MIRKLLIFLTLSIPLLSIAQQTAKPAGVNPTTTPTWFIDPTSHRATGFTGGYYFPWLTVQDTTSLLFTKWQALHGNNTTTGLWSYKSVLLKYAGTAGTPPSGYGEISLSSVGSEIITKANGQTRTFLFPYNGSTSARFPYKSASIIPDSTDVANTYVKKAGDTMTGSLFMTNSSMLTIGDSLSTYPNPSLILTRTVTATDTSSHGFVNRNRQNAGKSDAQFDDQFVVLDGKDYTGKHIAGFQMNAVNQATLPPTNVYSYITTFSNTGGTIPNYYGTFINNPTGSFGSKFGVYISPMSGASTNNYALFVASNTGKSYLGGSVLINKTTETPASYLTVKSLASGHRVVTYENTLGNEIFAFFNRASGDGQLQLNSSTGTNNLLLDAGTGTPSFILAGLNVGQASSTATAKLAVLSTTEQLRLQYDATHYAPFTVSSAGGLTIAPTAATTAITGAATVSTSVKTPFTILTGVTSGTAGTDSLLVKNATTNQVSKIAANYYATASGFVPTTRTLQFNYGLLPSTAQDLSANRSWALDTTGVFNKFLSTTRAFSGDINMGIHTINYAASGASMKMYSNTGQNNVEFTGTGVIKGGTGKTEQIVFGTNNITLQNIGGSNNSFIFLDSLATLLNTKMISARMTGIASGTAGTDSLLTKDAITNQVKKISGAYYATASTTPIRVINTITSNTTVPTLSGLADYSYNANSASQLTVTIPANSTAGARITVNGLGSGGWKLLLNTGDTIVSIGGSTTTGTGSVAGLQKGSITIECETTGSSGNTWIVKAVQGTPTYL